MKTSIHHIERRQSPRYRIQGMVIAVARPPSLPLGSIKEISQTGLTFYYRQNGNKWLVPQSIDIIWADFVATHHLEQIPVRTISDKIVEPATKPNKSMTRQFAVAFCNLTSHQKSEINRLIKERGAIKNYSDDFYQSAQNIIYETEHI